MNPQTIWLTGLSGSGKSTIAQALHERFECDHINATVLDGDVIRKGLCADLGFSPADRSENIRRIAHVCKLLNDASLTCIVAFISPYRADRELARQIVGAERFLEVHIATALAVCEERDPKGLYAKARSGELPSFTGISAPYEAPEHPALRLDTLNTPLSECVAALMKLTCSNR
ncbi:adenylyl-sulfate kinase [Viridibacterium curvum]|uniref:Adenylyl-sulfate kinase n=1 Tax=Viridibacterium curvum TaxID=1101404 RepID=A0ABP9R1E6_9RHOO